MATRASARMAAGKSAGVQAGAGAEGGEISWPAWLGGFGAFDREQLAVVAGRIRDWPDLDHRGFMLDISRDRVPDRACLA